jgi:hypothetical protein
MLTIPLHYVQVFTSILVLIFTSTPNPLRTYETAVILVRGALADISTFRKPSVRNKRIRISTKLSIKQPISILQIPDLGFE